MAEMTVILPERAEDAVSEGLRLLTMEICHRTGEEGGYGLGGEHGYGVNFENEIFSMHRYCWCGGNDCPWCSYSDQDGQHFQERFRQFGAVPDVNYSGAPNFWHKASDFKVWWYKWIGRDLQINQPCDLHGVLSDCLNSLPFTPSKG